MRLTALKRQLSIEFKKLVFVGCEIFHVVGGCLLLLL